MRVDESRWKCGPLSDSDDGMSDGITRDEIWSDDRLGRRHEANAIEAYITNEVDFFARTGRRQSIVLGIDAPYGSGKSWFLHRLTQQLKLSHPVATIDAWADDVGDEPLIAFMAAIDDALAPYLSNSKKLGDRLAAAKASALPVLGKLLSGAAIKVVTKIAGDEIEEDIGDAIENAVRGAKATAEDDKDGAASQAMTAAFEKLGSEIDSLVDRRGAAMLAAYRQRKQSRESFRANMHSLVEAIDDANGPGRSPLVVVIDELDRCRPNYAIRMLEEIKHFFDVPNVVFIIALHGGQLSKSVRVVYGSEFDSDDYLRRFFTRRYDLKVASIVDLTSYLFDEWKINDALLKFPEFVIGGDREKCTSRAVGLILAEWNVKPREVYHILDGLRLFIDGWEHDEAIEPIAVLCLLLKIIRGEGPSFSPPSEKNELKIRGTSWDSMGGGKPILYNLSHHLNAVNAFAWSFLSEVSDQSARDSDAAVNYVIDWIHNEIRARNAYQKLRVTKTHLADYIPRIRELARFVEDNVETD